MRILITGAGGAAAISVWKSLHSLHQLYMADTDVCAAGLYLVPPTQRIMIPFGHAPDFVDKVFQACQIHQIELLISTVDAELFPLAASQDRFADIKVIIPLSPKEALQTCRDKYALLTYCKDITQVPHSILLTQDSIASIDHFPLFAKPRLGSGSINAFTINNEKDLSQLPTDGTYLVQELLPGDEYSVDVYIHSSGRPIAAVPRLRMKVDSGIAVAARTQILPNLMEEALKIADLLSLRYVANIQFKGDKEGKLKLLEINPRFPGTLPLTAAAGIDMPTLLIQDVMGGPFSETLMLFKETMVVRYWTEHFCSPMEWEALCRQKQKLG